MSVRYHPDKANDVADAKKDLVRDVHGLSRLGVGLEDSSIGGVIVHHNSKSSLVVEVKYKSNTLMNLLWS